MPDLLFERVTAGYGGVPAVRDVSFTVGPGEVVGLVGPNGSGKTTLVRAASRTLRPLAGRVLVDGKDPYALRPREAARLVAVLPQDVAPVFPFSALEIVLMGRTPYHAPWAGGGPEDVRRAREAMETVDAWEFRGRLLTELSGGEKQQVILAQALAQDAPILLLDEPTAHLDVRHVLEILDMVQDLARNERKAVLAIFHDLNLAAAYSDQIVALGEGRIAMQGSPDEVIGRSLLRDVYGVEAEVVPNPVTGRPLVILGPGAARARAVGLRATRF